MHITFLIEGKNAGKMQVRVRVKRQAHKSIHAYPFSHNRLHHYTLYKTTTTKTTVNHTIHDAGKNKLPLKIAFHTDDR
jgi:hypothetical protein